MNSEHLISITKSTDSLGYSNLGTFIPISSSELTQLIATVGMCQAACKYNIVRAFQFCSASIGIERCT